jgi:DNA-binding beta-propeller fold protein YncE
MMTATAGVLPASASVSPGNAVGVGLPPTAIAVDAAAHTAYVVTSDASDDQVAVVDTAACTAHASGACTGAVTTVTLDVGSGPAADAVAFDGASNTVYVANASVGDVEMIDAATCNAVVTSGCATSPAVAVSGLAWPSALAVDTTGGHNVVYLADRTNNDVTVFNGATCSATATGGCGTTVTAAVGNAPDAIAVDTQEGTVYVANATDGSVSTLNEAACSASPARARGAAGLSRSVPVSHPRRSSRTRQTRPSSSRTPVETSRSSTPRIARSPSRRAARPPRAPCPGCPRREWA